MGARNTKWKIIDENGKQLIFLVHGNLRKEFTTKRHAEMVLGRQKGKRVKMYKIVEIKDEE